MAALLKAGLVAAALVTALACDTPGDGRNAVEGAEGRETAAANGGGPAPAVQAADSLRDTVPPLPVSWRFEPPPTWDERVRLVDDPAGDARLRGQGILSARHFEYLPRDTTIEAQTLLGVYVYDSTSWRRLGAQDGPPQGELVGRSPGVAYVVGLPQSNPFAPGSRDAAEFEPAVGHHDLHPARIPGRSIALGGSKEVAHFFRGRGVPQYMHDARRFIFTAPTT